MLRNPLSPLTKATGKTTVCPPPCLRPSLVVNFPLVNRVDVWRDAPHIVPFQAPAAIPPLYAMSVLAPPHFLLYASKPPLQSPPLYAMSVRVPPST